MAKEDNLKPFKKGQSGNPAGRKKGSRNRKTIVKQWLDAEETIKNPITGDKEMLSQADIMTLALIKKARNGDVQAYKELMDSGFGKLIQGFDHTTDGDKIANGPFEVKIVPPEDEE
jgi:hypothetical protein